MNVWNLVSNQVNKKFSQCQSVDFSSFKFKINLQIAYNEDFYAFSPWDYFLTTDCLPYTCIKIFIKLI